MATLTCGDCGAAFDADDRGALLAFGLVVCPACVQQDQQATQERRALRGDPYDPVYFGAQVGSVLEARVIQAMEDAAVAFAARYGVTDAWSDEQLDRALADHGYPPLDALPGLPHGLMADLATSPTSYPRTPREWRNQQRTNAAHLLGHIIAGHADRCCDGCRDWGSHAEAAEVEVEL